MARYSDQNLARSFIDGLPNPTNLGTSAPPKPLMTEGPLMGPTLQNAAPNGAPTIQSPVSPQAQVLPPKPSANPVWTPAMQAEIEAAKVAQSAQAAEAGIARRFSQFNSGSAAPFVGPPTPESAPPKPGASPGLPGIVGSAALLAPGAWHTGTEIKDRVTNGQGFWSSVGDTLKGNLQRSLQETIPDAVAIANANQITRTAQEPLLSRQEVQNVVSQATAPAPAQRASAFTDSAVHEPPSNLEVVPPTPQAVTPTLTSVGVGYGVDSNPARQGGFTAKHYYDPNGNIVASGVSSASNRGGFVGATTDAEAARNLQDRLAQDQAAQAMVASLNRGAEAERNARAERLGISRSVLDQMEGRPAPPSLFDAPQQTIQDATPFSRPGDGFGDAELRQARMQRDIEGAGGRKRDALVAQYAAEFTKPAHAGGGQNSSDDRLKLYLNQLDRMDKSRDRAVDNARADQSLELQRAQLRESQTQGQYNRDRGAAEFLRNQSNDRLKLGEDRLKASTQAAQRFVDDFKGQVDLTAVKNYGRQLIADPRLAQVDPGLAQRVRDNVLTYEDLHALKKMADAGRDPTHWYNPVSWFSDAPTPSQTVDKVYLNR